MDKEETIQKFTHTVMGFEWLALREENMGYHK